MKSSTLFPDYTCNMMGLARDLYWHKRIFRSVTKKAGGVPKPPAPPPQPPPRPPQPPPPPP
jgi:hypothetical protein